MQPAKTTTGQSGSTGSEKGHRFPSAHTLRQCGECGFYSYEGDCYCAYCGIGIRGYCPACHAEIRHPVAFYCTECGTPLPDRNERNPSHINSQQHGEIS